MAVIQFTAADALQTKVVPTAIYSCEISKFEGPKRSKEGKSNNFFVTIRIIEGAYKGKEKDVMFNSAMNSASVMGDMPMFPQAYLLALDSAINGREVTPEDYQMDTEALMNKPFDCQWNSVPGEVGGVLINTIGGFYPAGYGKTVPSF